MSILVNGSPTEDFKVGRGLRQGDPSSPFLFLIVAEGLASMMKKAVDVGRFRGFKVNANLHFQLLQFADDTIIMREGSWESFWTIKSMLRGFELVSGLKINFVKSKLYGINVGARILEAVASFLACNMATIPFKFLGIPVGANPRRRETWKPVVEAMTKRLNSWHNRHLSFGGRITLINSVLASIPLYFFSFFRAPCCVLKSIEKIQRNFLWGGGAEERKVCWVKWDQICLPKEKCGLGVKNLELFNLALLSKWKWRFLNHDNAIWADLLRYRYGHLPSLLLSGIDITPGAHSSLWWRDIISLGRRMSDSWFKSNISCCVGNEAIKNVKVSERLRGNGLVPLWRWNWSESLSVNEAKQLTELQGLFDGFSLHDNNHDQWRWIPDSNGLFTVKSCYTYLLNLRKVELQDAHVLEAIQRLWKSDVPSKVNVFGWRLLLNRLPTRAALHHRGILTNHHELSCVFCFQQAEDENHLFFSCPFSKGVWNKVLSWLGTSLQTGVEGRDHFLLFGDLFKMKDKGRVRYLVWLATTWNIWNLRNKVIFKGNIPDVSSLLETIKLHSWLWFTSRYRHRSCTPFPFWCLNPMSCILST
ncbi:unnamed protein product [Trifolium pratense]|uniref:Uncharacterized protein n=1 Tax=Trifolium pratense TaxID=57577 RepID=A0ACB0K5L3_TRIPR|nr:unnamed protein product [Trifolium pratense]